METIHDRYEHFCKLPSDINEHLPRIRYYASKCKYVTELGVRAMVSTWALLDGLTENGGYYAGIDIVNPEEFGEFKVAEVVRQCEKEGIRALFLIGDSLQIDIPETDLLFIDTLHTKQQLSGELARHHGIVKKYIIIHDTDSAADEMLPAIYDFLKDHPEWTIREQHAYNNGIIILAK